MKTALRTVGPFGFRWRRGMVKGEKQVPRGEWLPGHPVCWVMYLSKASKASKTDTRFLSLNKTSFVAIFLFVTGVTVSLLFPKLAPSPNLS